LIKSSQKTYLISLLTLFVINIGLSQTTSSTPTTASELELNIDVNLDGNTSSSTTVYLISDLSELLWLSENVNRDLLSIK